MGAGGGVGSTPVLECFAWAADAGSCPTDHIAVLDQFLAGGCPESGWTPYKVDSGPTVEPGQCCYMVELFLCPGSGRPYLVDGRPIVASAEVGRAGRGWGDAEARPQLDDLAPEARAALAAAWTADALLEHASVASFSRLSLALLAAGAPADLVAGAHGAALDEVRHARRCFALASAYAGEEIAPGPFPLEAEARAGAGLVELAVSTVREGCVGETVAAVTAAEQQAGALDPAVRAVLAEIAEDEARHAELAWRIVAWAVRAGGSEVREATARALFEAIGGAWRGPGAEVRAEEDGTLRAHGRLGASAAGKAVRAALAEVVVPCARALLAPGAGVRPRGRALTGEHETGAVLPHAGRSRAPYTGGAGVVQAPGAEGA